MAPGIPDFSDANLLSRVKCVEDNALKGLLGTISGPAQSFEYCLLAQIFSLKSKAEDSDC